MIGATLYVLMVSAFLSAAAWFAERILANGRVPRRGVWLAALLLSVAIPGWELPNALPGLSPVQLMPPAGVTETAPPLGTKPYGATSPAATVPAPAARMRHASRSSLRSRRFWTAAVYDRVLLAFFAGWGLISATLLLRWLSASATLRRRARRGTVIELDGTSLCVSDESCLAVVGIVRPWIIAPRWLVEAAASERSALVMHEREHLFAHDQSVLLAGRLLALLMPWNLPLWWSWRRLRLAVEADCDARVLQRGVPPACYTEALRAIGAHKPPVPRTTIDLVEHPSLVARRIRILEGVSGRWWSWTVLPLAAFTAFALLAAVTFPAPPIDAALGTRNADHRMALMQARQRAFDARATRRLLANGQPDALAAATLLGWPWPDGLRIVHDGLSAPPDAAQRLAWLARAVAEAPGRPDLLLLEVSECRTWGGHCDLARLDARLRALDPDNGAVWLDALADAVKAGDGAGIEAALTALGDTKRVDTYYTGLIARLAEALHRIGGASDAQASTEVAGMLGVVTLNYFTAFSAACNAQSDLTAERLHLCRKASVSFEDGDTLLSDSLGSAIAMRLWPAGTPQHRRAVASLRRLDYMEEQSQRLIWPPRHRLRTLLALWDGDFWARIVHRDARAPSEQEALRAQLIHAGLNPDPPAGWTDPNR